MELDWISLSHVTTRFWPCPRRHGSFVCFVFNVSDETIVAISHQLIVSSADQ